MRKEMAIPQPRETMKDSDKAAAHSGPELPAEQPLDAMYKVLPLEQQKWQLWAQALPAIEDAEGSQMDWSGEYFAKMAGDAARWKSRFDAAGRADACGGRI